MGFASKLKNESTVTRVNPAKMERAYKQAEFAKEDLPANIAMVRVAAFFYTQSLSHEIQPRQLRAKIIKFLQENRYLTGNGSINDHTTDELLTHTREFVLKKRGQSVLPEDEPEVNAERLVFAHALAGKAIASGDVGQMSQARLAAFLYSQSYSQDPEVEPLILGFLNKNGYLPKALEPAMTQNQRETMTECIAAAVTEMREKKQLQREGP